MVCLSLTHGLALSSFASSSIASATVYHLFRSKIENDASQFRFHLGQMKDVVDASANPDGATKSVTVSKID
jgi:hypothetical protein